MPSPAARATTTTHAILGLLALRPWTAYELAQRMERSFRFYWPRAQSKLYEEPKKLVALGWATVSEGATGDRRHRTYTITRAGRAALLAWLARPGAGPQLEHEALLKVALSDRGALPGLRANLQAIADEAAALQRFGRELAEEFLAGAPTFSERLHVGIFVWRFLQEFAALRERWARWALAFCEDWSDIEGDEERLEAARAELRRWLAALDRDEPLPDLRPARARGRR